MEAALAERGAVLLPPLGNRAAYAQAFAEGLGVTEGSPRSLAAAEMHALVAAVLAAVD
jgi:chromosome partitioning protein